MRRNAKLQPLVPFHGSNVQSKRCPCTYPCWSFKKLLIKTMQFKDIEISWNSICKMKRTFTERPRSSPFFGGSKIPKMRFMQTPPEIPLIELLVTTILSPKWNITKVSIYSSFLSMKLIRLILDQTNKNLWFTKTSSSSCRGVGAAKSTSPSWSSTCRNRQHDQARLTCSAMIFLGIYDIYVQQHIGSNSMQILLVAECGAHSWRVSHQTMAA